jgi:hypothetical protein
MLIALLWHIRPVGVNSKEGARVHEADVITLDDKAHGIAGLQGRRRMFQIGAFGWLVFLLTWGGEPTIQGFGA